MLTRHSNRLRVKLRQQLVRHVVEMASRRGRRRWPPTVKALHIWLMLRYRMFPRDGQLLPEVVYAWMERVETAATAAGFKPSEP